MRIVGILATLVACLLLARPVQAGEGCGTPDCCAHCGCHGACQPKVCQLVCGVEKVKKHCWCVECEEFCPLLPGCGKPCCDSCCEDCGPGCQDTCCEKGQQPCLVPPKCGCMRTKKILIKKEYECEVPVYKCVVRYLCGSCCTNPEATGPPVGPAPEPAPAPPAPLPGRQAAAFGSQPPR